MRIRTLAGALAISGLVAASVPADAEAQRHSARDRDRGYSSRSYRSSGPQRSSRSHVNRDRAYNSSRSSRSYGYRDRGYSSYRSYNRYRSYAPRRSYYRPHSYYRPYRYTRAYAPYYYGYAYDPYAYDSYGYEPYGYGYDNGPYPRYRSRAHYHGRLFCVRPHLSVHIGF